MAILLNGWIFPNGQSGEASRWRVCYQRGLPRLVYDIMKIWRKRLTQSVSQSVNDEAVYRTAPATPGLLTRRVRPR